MNSVSYVYPDYYASAPLEILGPHKASELAHAYFPKNRDPIPIKSKGNYLLSKFMVLNLDSIVNQNLSWTLSITLNMSFHDPEANNLVFKLRNEIAFAAGSSCHSGQVLLFNIQKAILPSSEYAKGTIRSSVGKKTTIEEIDRAITIFINHL